MSGSSSRPDGTGIRHAARLLAPGGRVAIRQSRPGGSIDRRSCNSRTTHECHAEVSQSLQHFAFAIWPERNLPVSPKPAVNPKTATLPKGFRMPAEWEPHAATWLAWPHQASDWPGKLAVIPWIYAEIIRHLHRNEDVHLLVNDQSKESAARRVLIKAPADGASPLATDASGRELQPSSTVRTGKGTARLAVQRLGEVP